MRIHRILIGLLICLTVLFAVSLTQVLNRRQEPEPESLPEPAAEPTATPEPVIKEEYEYEDAELEQLTQELKQDQEINPDVQAILRFQSGLIHEAVLQSASVDEYLHKNWETGEYRSYGSIVMDPENDVSRDDQNTIIYGHYIYEYRNPDRTLVFTPLAQLTEKEAWEENRYVSLITNTEVRYYEIASVFECPLVTYEGYQVTIDELQYNLLSYDKEYMEVFRNAVKAHEYFSTGIAFDETDHFLTLQTCIEGNADSREIVFCRELMRKPLNETADEEMNNGTEGKDN